MIDLKITGVRAVTRRLRRTRTRLLRDVEQQVDRAIRPSVIKAALPKRTGRLRRTVRVLKRRRRDRVDWSVIVGGRKAVYAPYVKVKGQSGRARYAFGRMVRQRVERGVRGIRRRSY